MKKNKEKKGFTLIELLGVLVIVAILASIGIFIFANVTNESKTIVNAITKESIQKAALTYVKEYKNLDDRFWYDKEGSSEKIMYTCTTIKQLINTGYLPNNLVDAETGKKYDDVTTIKVERDANKVLISDITLDAIECDNSPPSAKITFSGTTFTEEDGKIWYNSQEDASFKIEPITGISGIAEYEYYLKDTNGKKKSIVKGFEKESFESRFIDILGTYSNNYGKNVKVCAQLRNGNDMESGEICESVNLDFTKPTIPILKTSDNILTNNWHKNNFDINVSGGGSSPSGIYYVYSVDSDELKNKLSNSKISILEETTNKEYKFKTCNNAGICSDIVSYIVKVDKTKPEISSFISMYNGSGYVASIPLKGVSKDTLSGIVKYKIDKSSSYNNNGWTNVTNTTSSIELNGMATSNGNFYLWVEDAAGNYNYKYIRISKCGKLYTKNVRAYSENGSTITDSINIPGILKLESVTVNTGYVYSSYLSGNNVSYTLKGGYTYEGSYTGTCKTSPDTYRAYEDKYCDRYYCPRGGRLSGNKCVGSSYSERGTKTGTFKCSCSKYTHKYLNCGGESVVSVYCDEGYVDGGYTLYPTNIPQNGQPCSRDYTVERYGIKRCIWRGDYYASCSSYETDYYCDRGDILNYRTCYTCSRGTINSSGTSCSYSCTKYYDYWEYNVVVKYYA